MTVRSCFSPRRSPGRLMTRVLIGVGFSALLFSGPAAHAQLPTTRLFALFPPGGQQDSQFEATITAGADTEGVDRLVFSHPGITATQKTQQVEGQEAPQPVANQFIVTVAADVPPGMHEVRAAGTYGVSNPRMFVVSQQAEAIEVEPNNEPNQATEIAVESNVSGRCNQAADIDYFRFTAPAGERFIIRCLAQAIDSQMDATLELYDSTGRRIAASRDYEGHDPLIDFTAASDGQYLLKVFDFTFTGGNERFYRFSVSARPYVETVFPPSVTPGATASLLLFGRNLPSGEATELLARDGRPLERQSIDFTLPAEVAEQLRYPWAHRVTIAQGAQECAPLSITNSQGISNPVHIGRAAAPVVAEVEPNDTADSAQSITLPCEVTGQFQNTNDHDWFSFEAKKGEVYWIEVFASRIGAPCDPHLFVQQVTTNDKGEQQVKDLTAIDNKADNIARISLYVQSPNDDPFHRLDVPADGIYRVRIMDLYNDVRGDPSMVYRLAIRPESPDFRFVAMAAMPRNLADQNVQHAVDPWPLRLRKGGRQQIRVYAYRQHGFNGPIDVTVEGLPAGVTADPATIGPGQLETRVVISATDEAADWSGPIHLRGTSKIGDAQVARDVRPATVVWNSTALPGRIRLSRDLVLSVGEAAPYSVSADWSAASVPQSYQLPVPIQVARSEGFANDLTLQGVLLPNKVQSPAITIKGDQSTGMAYLYIPQDTPPGRYSFFLQTTGKVSFKKPSEEKPSDRVVFYPSNAATLTIEPGPLVLSANVPGGGAVKVGASIEIPIKVQRRNGAAESVKLTLRLPPGIAGVTAEEVELPADQTDAKLVVQAAADATVGNHANVVVRATTPFNGSETEVHLPIPLNVQK